MSIPDDIRERMRKAGSGDEARDVGVKIAQEALLAARELAQGTYIMPPFNRVELAVRVVEILSR
jgi:homocysteine S-methyltransferase